MEENKNFNFVFLDDIYYKTDSEGKILYVSSSVKKVLGYDPEELIGSYVNNLYVKPQNRAIKYKEIPQNANNFIIEEAVKHKEGHHVFMSTHARFIKDARGNKIAVEGISRDITREHELKRRLLESEKRYKAIFKNSPSGIIYYNSQGIIIEANKAALKIFGVAKEQFIGFDLLKSLKDKNLYKAVETSLAGKTTHYKGLHTTILTKKQVYLNISFQAVKSENGNVKFIVASLTDEMAISKVLARLKKSKEEWKSIIDNMQNIFLQTDKDGIILKVSPSIKKVTGYDANEMLGKEISFFWRDTKKEKFKKKYLERLTPVKNVEFSLIHKNGSTIYFDCNISPRLDKNGNYAGSDNFAQDITELKKSQEKIEYMGKHDTLTTLPNRAMLVTVLEYAILSAKRVRKQMAILFLDLDNFKNINDNFGHQEGDKVLVKIADSLKKVLRLDDMIFRFGGDEFVIVVEHIKHNEDVVNIIEKINKIFKIPLETDFRSYHLSCSIGIAIYPDDALSAEKLMKSADIAMYQAKNSGKDRYAFYSEALGKKIQKEVYIENLLRNAIKNREFEIYYQPQISLKEKKIAGIEALIRWNSPELGFVSPDNFIKIAEKTHLIASIDEWVMKTACMQVKKWHDLGVYNGDVSVNISGADLNYKDMVVLLQDAINESGLDAKFLDLEITETVLMSDPEHSIRLFNKIKEIGIDVSIDDFGTGYSSLSYLRMFPIDELKIDKSFVDDLPNSKDASAITNTIISLAQTLDYKTVAEGVETLEQLEYLKRAGCDIMQGYYYSKPLSVSDIEVYFQNFS